MAPSCGSSPSVSAFVRATVRVTLQRLLHQQGKAIEALWSAPVSARPYPDLARHPDHGRYNTAITRARTTACRRSPAVRDPARSLGAAAAVGDRHGGCSAVWPPANSDGAVSMAGAQAMTTGANARVSCSASPSRVRLAIRTTKAWVCAVQRNQRHVE